VLLVLGLVTPVLMPMVGRVDLVLVDQSVRPGLHRGDVLLTRPAAERDLRPGRVVIVDSDEGRVVHRIRAVGDGPRLRGGGMSAATRIAVDGSGGASPGWVQVEDVVATRVTTITGPNAALIRVVTGRIGVTLLLVVFLSILVAASLRARTELPAADLPGPDVPGTGPDGSAPGGAGS